MLPRAAAEGRWQSQRAHDSVRHTHTTQPWQRDPGRSWGSRHGRDVLCYMFCQHSVLVMLRGTVHGASLLWVWHNWLYHWIPASP